MLVHDGESRKDHPHLTSGTLIGLFSSQICLTALETENTTLH